MTPEELKKAVQTIKLVKAPNPVLNKKCDPMEWTYPHTILANSMLDIMKNSNGIGLAAPQVGLSIRFIVAKVEGHLIEMANPEIIEKSEDQEWQDEGCLSFPGIDVPVLRSKEIKLRGMVATDYYSTYYLKGLMARVIQHEVDHLDGICHVNYLDRNERRRIMSTLKKQQKRKNGR